MPFRLRSRRRKDHRPTSPFDSSRDRRRCRPRVRLLEDRTLLSTSVAISLAPDGSGSVTDTFDLEGDPNSYEFTAAVTGEMTIDPGPPGNSPDLALLDSSQNPLLTSFSSALSFHVLAGQSYFVDATPDQFTSSPGSSYTLTFSTLAGNLGSAIGNPIGVTLETGSTYLAESLDYAGDTDFFEFVAPGTGQLTLAHFAGYPAGVATNATVYDASHNVIASDDPATSAPNLPTPAAFSVIQGQTYEVKITSADSSSATGSYVLYSVLTLPLSISPGTTTTSGSLDVLFDDAYYNFVAPVTGEMSLTHSALLESGEPTVATVSDSDGIVATDDPSRGGLGYGLPSSFHVIAGQTYSVQIGSADLSSTGSFSLAFTLVADDDGNTFADAGTLPMTDGVASIVGSIDYASDVDVYQFSATATGEMSIAHGAAGGGSLASYVEVFDSNESLIATDGPRFPRETVDNPSGFHVVTGQTYYVQIQADDGTSVGNYFLNSSFVADDFGNSFQDAYPLTIGAGTTTQSGAIDYAGDTDVFTFTAPESGQMDVGHEDSEGSTNSDFVTIYDNGGRIVATDDPSLLPADSPSPGGFHVDAGSTYFVEVGSIAGAGTAGYSLSLNLAVDDYGNGPDDAAPVVIFAGETTIPGGIDYPSDVDEFTFVAPFTGTLAVANTAGLDPSVLTYATIYTLDQEVVATNDPANAPLAFDLISSAEVIAGQTYYIQVNAADPAAVGSYVVDLQLTQAATDTIQVATGETDQTRSIDTMGGIDVFSFTPTVSGHFSLFHGLLNEALLPTVATVYDDSGLVASDDPLYEFQVNANPTDFFVTAGQTYSVAISSADDVSTGDYALSMTLQSDDYGNTDSDADPLDFSTGHATASGTIDYAGDLDVFQFTAPANGQVSLFHNATSSSGVATYATVFTTFAVVASDDPFYSGYGVSSLSSFRVTSGQTYYVQLSAADGTSVGGYQLDLSLNADDFGNNFIDAAPLNFVSDPVSQAGSIDYAGDLDDFYFFSFLTGQVSVSHVAAAGSNVSTVVTVFDGNGNVVASDDPVQTATDGALPSSFDVSYGVTYYVQIRAVDGTSTGGYVLSLTSHANEEFGNDFAHASPLPAPFLARDQYGDIDYLGDSNVFSFVATETTSLTVAFNATAGSALLGSIQAYDGNENLLASAVEGSGGASPSIGFGVVQGQTYYLKISAVPQATGSMAVGAYFLRFSAQATLESSPNHTVATASELTFGFPQEEDMSAGAPAYFRFTTTSDGRLVVNLSGSGTSSRLSLLDSQGHVIIQSDGAARGNANGAFDLHLSPGTYYLEVGNGARDGSVVVSANFTSTEAPLAPIATSVASSSYYPLAEGDFNGDGKADLVLPDGVHLGVGDGTFAPAPGGNFTSQVFAGTSYATGDFNHDGKLDLAVTSEIFGSVTILLGNGDGTFQSGASIPVGAKPRGLVTGYFTDSGNLDIAVANSFSNSVSILIGNGDGIFQTPVSVPVGLFPQSIVAGDFTGDGRTDLAVNDPYDNSVDILQNIGDGQFQALPPVSVGIDPSALLAGDFDLDGQVDLAVLNSGSSTMSIVRKAAGGGFATESTIAVGSDPVALVSGDFNGDGVSDLAVACAGSAGAGSITILLGLSGGGFRVEPPIAAGNNLGLIVAGDWNGDHKFDLAVADDVSASVSILLGDGDGTFQVQPHFAAGYAPGVLNSPSAVASGDFNGDGNVDLAIANADTNNLTILLGDGDGTFRAQPAIPVGSLPNAVTVGDFNGDGIPDLAVANFYSDTVTVLLGNGDGTFRAGSSPTVGAQPNDLVAKDFNGDGKQDLAVLNQYSDSVTLLLGNGDGTFRTGSTTQVNHLPALLTAGDFNGDNHVDLAVASGNDPSIVILLGNGDGTFSAQPKIAVPAPIGVVAGDFNNDGHLDLATSNYGGSVTVLLGAGDGTFVPQSPITVGLTPAQIITGHFDKSGNLDLAVVNNGAGSITVLLGNGTGQFQAQPAIAVGSAPRGLITADLNNDGTLDLAVASQQSNSLSILIGQGDGSFQPQARRTIGATAGALVAGDFTNDGKLDLVFTNVVSSTSILMGHGDGTFQQQSPITVGGGSDALVASDFNRDGKLDLAVGNLETKSVSILLGNGDGTFQTQAPIAVGSDPVALVSGDFNGDGKLDLAVANYASSTIAIFLGNGDGTFRTAASIAVGSLPDALVAGDFNNDGRLDLAVADAGTGTVTLLLGNGNATFRVGSTIAVGGQPTALAAGDFTGDGKLDLAVANSVDDTVAILVGIGDGSFRASAPIKVGSDPASILAGDFNGDGRMDLAVANAGDDNVSILIGLGTGGFQAQVSLAAANGPFALVEGDFNGDGRPDVAIANSGSNDVGVLVNAGQTTTGMPDLVDPDQVAANVQNIPVVADFNRDGTNDVAVVNSAGEILFRQGRSDQVGTFDPPIVVNPNVPARDIALVMTPGGPLIAAVDEFENSVSLYRYAQGAFTLTATLTTGAIPEQIVVADLEGGQSQDLVVRNAGDGTLSIFVPDGSGSFQAPLTQAIGLGISDLVVQDVNQDGLPDIVLANQVTGVVQVLINEGGDRFSNPVTYRAGGGLYNVTTGGDGSSQIQSLEGTSSVGVVGTAGGSPDLVAINSGSETLGVLAGLGDGRFANPAILDLPGADTLIRAARLTSSEALDLIVVGPEGVSLAFGTAQGGYTNFVRLNAGLNPTGVTVADLNGDPDLLVGNSFGDILVLLGNGQGEFTAPQEVDRGVGLAVGNGQGGGASQFIFSDKSNDRITVQSNAGIASSVLADQASGLHNPGSVVLRDLNGDGIPDLIAANGGGNDVLVYPGLGNGQYGPALNGGFSTGTDPVGITVARLAPNGPLDLIVANKGSDDVSILLNQALPGGGFTFVLGPRLKVGDGPVSTAVMDVNGDGIPDLLVTNSGSNNVSLLPGVGNGFFSDVNPTLIPVGLDPGPLLILPNAVTPGQFDMVTVNSGSNTLSVFYDIIGGHFVAQPPISSGGELPIAAVAGSFGSGGSSLLVANNASGEFALFQDGAGGLSLLKTFEESGLPNPSGLAVDSLGDVFATTDGVENAFQILGLGANLASALADFNAQGSEIIASASEQQLVLLQPFSETSLALIATLLSVSSEVTFEEGAGSTATAALPTQALAQSGATTGGDQGENVATETELAAPPAQAVSTAVARFMIALNDAFAKARIKARDGSLFAKGGNAGASRASLKTLDTLLAQWSPIVSTIAGAKAALALDLGRAGVAAAQALDQAIESLNTNAEQGDAGPTATLIPDEVVPAADVSPTPIGAISIGVVALARPVSDLIRPYLWPSRRSRRRERKAKRA